MRCADRIDVVLLSVAVSMFAVGVLMVYSSSAASSGAVYGSTSRFLALQAMWVAAGLVVIAAASRTRPRHLVALGVPLVLAAIVLLVVVLFMPTVRGAHRWVRLGSMSLQPSELFLSGLVLVMSGSLAKRAADLRGLRLFISPYVILIAIGSLLVALGRDLGMSITVFSAGLAMLFLGGARLRHVVVAVAAVAVAAVLVVGAVGYNRARVHEYVALWTAPDGGSYQVRQSLIAMGSGGATGVGLGEGRQKMFFLPEPHTDFILAIVGEETGFAGVSAVVAGYLIVLWRGLRIAARAADRASSLLAAGFSLMITGRAVLNAAVVAGLLPTTGVPLPFLSYGGTSTLSTALAVGAILSASRGATGKAQAGGFVRAGAAPWRA